MREEENGNRRPDLFGKDGFNLSDTEEEVLRFWDSKRIVEQTFSLRKKSKTFLTRLLGKSNDFVFFEGPPTANGRPGTHHVLSRAFKDIIPRYKTMRGYHVPRKGGWDTHGLPVELEVEKKLGIRSKKEIEEYGIAEFNKRCRESVWEYKEEWERFTKRIGFWLDLDDPYITYQKEYIETLWWIVKRFHKRGLLFKGHKVVPWCTRCGTALSSHELAQGYQEDKDTAVYVKFRLKPGQEWGKGYRTQDSAYILSWTTTPWTLPGNVALAVGNDICYVALRPEGTKELHIVAKNLVESVYGDENVEIVHDDIAGKELTELEYEPLFDVPALKNERSHRVYAADFVTTEDGTGVVHTAVMYGEDDYELGVRNDLPRHHTVGEDGMFTTDVPELSGMQAKSVETDEKIIGLLEAKNLLLRKEAYAHEYPHCWRCGTALLYYARESWFVAMSRLREKLIAENDKVNWVPAHDRHGRFGEWLKEVKDWNFSRERYWGTPLPVWECAGCGTQEVVGSFEELSARDPRQNRFFFVRHTEAEHNTGNYLAAGLETKGKVTHLTPWGEEDVKEVADRFRSMNITAVYTSPFLRTKRLAEEIGKVTDVPVTEDPRLGERDFGVFNWKPYQEYLKAFPKDIDRFTVAPEGGETYNDVRQRVYGALKDIDARHRNGNIVIVTHGDPIKLMTATLAGIPDENIRGSIDPRLGEARESVLMNLPRDEFGRVDPHRPYIDEIELPCSSCGGVMQRVSQVIDVWFDSGAVPFAQAHFPFSCGREPGDPSSCVYYPADYIAEAVDQTRGWFYTLLAVAVALGYERPYKNVMSLRHILDKHGKKMSKSKGNVVDPWEMMGKYGVDAMRWYFYTMNSPGDTKNFDEAEVRKTLQRFHSLVYNCLSFYNTYADRRGDVSVAGHVLDKWVFARLHETIGKTTDFLDIYDIRAAALSIEEFASDLSRWYVRRSRERFKGGGQERTSASYVLGTCLLELSKLVAPFNPFFAEALYSAVDHKALEGGKKDSVHLADWPSAEPFRSDTGLVADMEEVRKVASAALAVRAEQGVKVRQPLSVIKTRLLSKRVVDSPELLAVLREEINVKEVVSDLDLGSDVWLDIELTPELREEGALREVVRAVQELRQKSGLQTGDPVAVFVWGSGIVEDLVRKNEGDVMRQVNAGNVRYEKPDQAQAETTLKCNDEEVCLGIQAST